MNYKVELPGSHPRVIDDSNILDGTPEFKQEQLIKKYNKMMGIIGTHPDANGVVPRHKITPSNAPVYRPRDNRIATWGELVKAERDQVSSDVAKEAGKAFTAAFVESLANLRRG